MKNTKLLKALIVAWIALSSVLLTWRAIKNHELDVFFFYLFFVVLFIHIAYGAFKLVDFFNISLKIPDIFLYAGVVLLILLIACIHPNLIAQFIFLALFFILTGWTYYRLGKKTKNKAYKKYAFEKSKLGFSAIILSVSVSILLYLHPLKLIAGILLFIGQFLWIFWMFFIKRIYSVK